MVVALDFACEGASGRRPRRHVFTLTMRGPDGPAPTLPFGLGRAAPDRFRSTSRKPSQPIEAERPLETTAPGVWAMGDCAGSPQFTHVAGDDFRIISDNLAGGSRSTRYRLVPYCMFTDPPLAHVGLSDGRRSAMASRCG